MPVPVLDTENTKDKEITALGNSKLLIKSIKYALYQLFFKH